MRMQAVPETAAREHSEIVCRAPETSTESADSRGSNLRRAEAEREVQAHLRKEATHEVEHEERA